MVDFSGLSAALDVGNLPSASTLQAADKAVVVQGGQRASVPVGTLATAPDTVTIVASLPAASAVPTGTSYIVTDASSPALGATVTGGSTTRCRVNSDGTNWKVG
jgi:hypothetical protein